VWSSALQVVGLNDVTTSTSVISTWDDHEVSNNWNWNTEGVPDLVADSLTAFRRAIPQRTGPNDVMWHKLSWGAAMDVFVLDCRGERRNGDYISPQQLAWLKEELSASTATFKLMVNSVPIADFSGTVAGALGADDRWQGFPAQRTELLTHIRDNNITGVFWIAGDLHIGGIGSVDAPGGPGEHMYEVLAGPGGSPINAGAGFFNPDERFPSIIKTWNYALFEANPVAGTVNVRFFDDDGAVLDEHLLQVL